PGAASFAGAGSAAAAAAGACQPQLRPSFCCLSHSCSGEKYSSTAEASICSVPVSSFIVCCQGWLLPRESIAQNLPPPALLPAKVHSYRGPWWPAASHSAL